MEDPEEYVELPGEGDLMDFWLRVTAEVIKLANDLKLSDEDLDRLLARYLPRDGALSCGISALVQEIQIHRSLLKLGEEIRPGEELIPLSELATRRRNRKDSGEN